ncbi:MAG: STN and carboxypeptidase regulatory-like domain-containing protein [Chitinophagaceae bacterium]
MKNRKRIWSGCIILVVLLCTLSSSAQSILDRRVSFNANRQRLDDVLAIVSNKANFSFSYNSNILKRDSLVNLVIENKTVRQVLNLLFNGNYEYKESGNYVILRRVSLQLTTVTKTEPSKEKIYTISGYVVNSETGERLSNVSIYETNHLTSTLTDDNGNFTLKLKDKYQTSSLAVSRDAYEDTVVSIQPKYDLQLVIAIVPVVNEIIGSTPNKFEQVDTTGSAITNDSTPVIKSAAPDEVEKTQMGKFLLTAKQKIRSLNMKKFFTEKPFQFSVIPGVSSQGKMSGQVVNNFSLNLFGGYTAGVNGLEIGGLFNLNKKDVRYLQAAGLFNIAGGSMTGLQIGGLQNTVLKNVKGLQASGINNFVKGNVNGLQVAGIGNISGGTMNGFQAAGVFNYQNRNSNGIQVAGVGNIGGGEVKGLQIGGVFNYAKKLKGVQIGLINIADTSDGYSIGLINVILKGYHKFSLYTNEVTNANAAFKTGSRRFYSILQAGTNAGKEGEKIFTFGYGLGTEMNIAKWLSVNPELGSQYVYLGTWDHLNLLNKLHLNLNIKFGKRFSVFGGPSFTAYYSEQIAAVGGYKYDLVPPSYHSFRLGSDKLRGWFGWNAGINLF